ncbi:MAG TPA: hypothetical protein VM638_05035 [Actinomycetota bacterium]|nr:hypothetical protein [Actinomycetota bacterium]
MPGSRKARDLLRDPRLALHGPTEDPPEPPGPWDGEAKLAGLAVPIERHVAEGPPAEWFRLDIREAVLTWIGDPPDRLLIDSWHPERGLRRRERR